MYLGREIPRTGLRGRLGFLDKAEMRRRSDEAFRNLGVRIADTAAPVANMFLGREVVRPGLLGKLGFLDKGEMRKRSDAAFRDLGVRIQDTGARVANMSGGQRQGIAICRAVTWAKKVVFMDEPTAALGVVQTRNVLDHIRRVRDQGLSVVLISHNMPEVFEVADRIEVLRLGERVARLRPKEVSMEDVVSAMTGALKFHEEDGA